jgi:ubiquinone/menaquinone biosynthesis C-methylase UbiE
VEADAESLPFEDESFDVVMSAIGVIFAPHHQDAADELVRVCRPGGTIGLLSWTPEGMLGALFRMMKRLRRRLRRAPSHRHCGEVRTICTGSSAAASSSTP